MFFLGARWVCCGVGDGEVVVDFSYVDGGGGLGDQLGAAHGLAVPEGGVVDCYFDTLGGGGVGRVFEGGGEVDIVGDGAGTVDVVLVRTDRV